jgi:hypothetical protein
MEMGTTYYAASGSNNHACAFLAQRFNAAWGYRPNDSECWVVGLCPGDESDESSVTLLRGTTGWLTGLWRSDEGYVFVCDADGYVLWLPSHHCSDFPDSAWNELKLKGSLTGIWGLSSRMVFAWGGTRTAPVLYQWDGTAWNDVKPPSFEIVAMHGLSADLIWASGPNGQVARRVGDTWDEQRTPVGDSLTSVFVAAPNEYYAASNFGSILEGSDFGWAKIGEIPGALQGDVQAVAKWNGDLWVAASRLGLWRRIDKGNQYDCVKDNLVPVSLDVRGELLAGCEDGIGSSLDGKSFAFSAESSVLDARDGKDLCDFG